MKRRYAFAQFYILDLLPRIIPGEGRTGGRRIIQLWGEGSTLELNPGWGIDTQAQRAREHCIGNGHYAFTLHRATKPMRPNKYANVITTREMEIVQWALDQV